MCIRKYCIVLIILLFCVGVALAQEVRTDINTDIRDDKEYLSVYSLCNSTYENKKIENIEVHFKFDNYNLDLDYMCNEKSLQDFAHKIDSIGVSNIDSIIIVSQSSPEGVYEHNLMLSRNRANTMRKYILSKHPELRNCLHVYPDGESWIQLREYVKNDTLMKRSTIKKVISIIDSDINVGTKKWRMEQLPVYRYMLTTYYPRIRNSAFYILYYTEKRHADLPIEIIKPKAVVETVDFKPNAARIVIPFVPEVEGCARKLNIKTNAIGLGMGIANVAVEIDMTKHWSFALPVYYSAWNYFKTTIKFRTFAIQPEFRYWLSEDNDGLFAGAHFGLGYYNFAFDGDYRYQDHGGVTPSLGGGVSVGYRIPIGIDKRWRVEFSLGAGVYSLYLDKFYNTPNTKDGLIIESIKKTYCGIDQVAVSFSYSIDLNEKGGKL